MINYSSSKCPKCENTNFEIVEDVPLNSNFKFWYLRCMTCKTLIQAIPFIDLNSRITKLAKALNINLDN